MIQSEGSTDCMLIMVRVILLTPPVCVVCICMSDPPIKFGDDPDLTGKECHSLLREYMPAHVTGNKVLQQLFIKYSCKLN